MRCSRNASSNLLPSRSHTDYRDSLLMMSWKKRDCTICTMDLIASTAWEAWCNNSNNLVIPSSILPHRPIYTRVSSSYNPIELESSAWITNLYKSRIGYSLLCGEGLPKKRDDRVKNRIRQKWVNHSNSTCWPDTMKKACCKRGKTNYNVVFVEVSLIAAIHSLVLNVILTFM